MTYNSCRRGPARWVLLFVLAGLMLAGRLAAGMPPDAVHVAEDEYGVPVIIAGTFDDAFRMVGYLHARDRFFQMDLNRRQFSGTLAELVGGSALFSDLQFRTLGLRRAAAESLLVISPETRAWLTAYAAGVNDWLAGVAGALPAEYQSLELTAAEIPLWTEVDTLTIIKGLAFGLSFDLQDLSLTEAWLSFQAAGAANNFDGAALFSEDLYRSAPFDPAVTIPDAPLRQVPARPAVKASPRPSYLHGRTLTLLRQVREKYARVPRLARALRPSEWSAGSNWWLVAGGLTETGDPLMANDPHLALDTPAMFWEVRVRVHSPARPLDVFGITFPGAPMIVLGCNRHISWSATVNPMDVTDLYQERLVLDPVSGLPTHTIFEGTPEPLRVIPQIYLINQVGDGTPDNLVQAQVGLLDGAMTFIVPRRNNGPLIAFDFSDPEDPIALSVQYTGFRATREPDAFRRWALAENLADFREGLEFFDFGSQNFGYADIDGTIAYFVGGEMPVREDLQILGAPDGGAPPYMVRDGAHEFRHEWLPVANPQPHQSLAYEILPAAEMPHEINPARGYIISANNDPLGLCLDNDALNQLRPGGGIFYLNPGYAIGCRAGRLRDLFDAALAGKGPLSVQTMMDFQADHQLLDAEVFVPYLLVAFDNARKRPATPAGKLADAAAVSEAVERLRQWDSSTPTGIAAGYDPGDDPDNLPVPALEEVEASVAATIYAVWRGQLIKRMIDDPLDGYGLRWLAPGSDRSMVAIRHLLDNFAVNQGVGASGIEFIPDGDLDAVLLQALADALNLLAGSKFVAAFQNSTNQDDYRWGYLHRIVLNHPLGGSYNIPPAGGLTDLAPGLPGLARSGGYNTVDAASHSSRADATNEFMFGSGPTRRFVGQLAPDGIIMHQVIPGGAGGVKDSPHQADQLRLWLTNAYVRRDLRPRPGDLNGDDSVDAADILFFSGYLVESVDCPMCFPLEVADLNNDGRIDVVDHLLLKLTVEQGP